MLVTTLHANGGGLFPLIQAMNKLNKLSPQSEGMLLAESSTKNTGMYLVFENLCTCAAMLWV